MKKILSATLAFTIMATAAFAQGAKQQPKKMQAKTKTETTTQTTPTKHLKKDGTPDMRYKENRVAKPAKAPAKSK